jgi:hypothetical protein
MSGCSVCPVPHLSSHFITCLVIHIIITSGIHPSNNYLLVAKSPGRPVRFYVSLARGFVQHVYTIRGRPRRWRKSVEVEPHGRSAMWLGRPTTTWRVTDLTRSEISPWTPINTPLPVEIRTHTIFWRFHLQSSHS